MNDERSNLFLRFLSTEQVNRNEPAEGESLVRLDDAKEDGHGAAYLPTQDRAAVTLVGDEAQGVDARRSQHTKGSHGTTQGVDRSFLSANLLSNDRSSTCYLLESLSRSFS